MPSQEEETIILSNNSTSNTLNGTNNSSNGQTKPEQSSKPQSTGNNTSSASNTSANSNQKSDTMQSNAKLNTPASTPASTPQTNSNNNSNSNSNNKSSTTTATPNTNQTNNSSSSSVKSEPKPNANQQSNNNQQNRNNNNNLNHHQNQNNQQRNNNQNMTNGNRNNNNNNPNNRNNNNNQKNGAGNFNNQNRNQNNNNKSNNFNNNNNNSSTNDGMNSNRPNNNNNNSNNSNNYSNRNENQNDNKQRYNNVNGHHSSSSGNLNSSNDHKEIKHEHNASMNGLGGGGGGKSHSSSSNLASTVASAASAAATAASQTGEKKFTGRCRLFVGNLPSDITENEFKELFFKYGEVGECFLNTQRSFGFVKLDTRINAEHAKQDLDGYTFKGRCIRVRFASHGAAVRVKNLSPYVSNEYLEQAFSIFGPVERAVVIVDDKGRPTGEGIVEFERKPAASQCINKCTENCFILTSYPKPVIVEPLDQKDDEDGLPEKSIMKNSQFHSEREAAPHFAQNNSFELKLAMKWRELYELEKQINEDGKKRVDQAREMLEYEIEQAMIDHKTMKLKEDLRAKQEELQRIEDMRKSEFQRRQDMELRRQEEERRRQEEMMLLRKQQETIIMSQQQNSRSGQPNMPDMRMQQQFDSPLLSQPHNPVLAGQMGPPNNRRFDGNQSNQLGASQFQGQPPIPPSGPAQQQAMLAQLSAIAMAAAQGNLNLPMFENQNGMNNNMGKNGGGGGGGGNNNNQNRDEHRGGSGGGPRRQFDRRGGRGGHGNRDDSSPYPGYDPKRARF